MGKKINNNSTQIVSDLCSLWQKTKSLHCFPGKYFEKYFPQKYEEKQTHTFYVMAYQVVIISQKCDSIFL